MDTMFENLDFRFDKENNDERPFSYPCLYHGGNYSQDQNHGPFYVNCYSTSISIVYIGCRLQERPPKAA